MCSYLPIYTWRARVRYLILLMGILLCSQSAAAQQEIRSPTETVNSSMRVLEKKIRSAAVKVTNPYLGVHGSGSYIIYKDIHIVITAQHVVNGALGTSYRVSHGTEDRIHRTSIYCVHKKKSGQFYFFEFFFHEQFFFPESRSGMDL